VLKRAATGHGRVTGRAIDRVVERRAAIAVALNGATDEVGASGRKQIVRQPGRADVSQQHAPVRP